jgi:hypothetical protein
MFFSSFWGLWWVWGSSVLKNSWRETLGNGAGFALEDVYALAASISWAYERDLNLSEGLNLFDQVRSPHYAKLVGSISSSPFNSISQWADNIITVWNLRRVWKDGCICTGIQFWFWWSCKGLDRTDLEPETSLVIWLWCESPLYSSKTFRGIANPTSTRSGRVSQTQSKPPTPSLLQADFPADSEEADT